jgi:hypothetical protein
MDGRPRSHLPRSRDVVRMPLTTRSGFVGVRRRTSMVAALGTFLAYALLLAAPVHALDPNTRLTQYSHTSWRMQDGSAPSGMYSIAQTTDGFLWFLSSPRGEVYRFDGARFRPWGKLADDEPIGRVRSLVGVGRRWPTARDGSRTIFHFTLPKYDDEKSATGVKGA